MQNRIAIEALVPGRRYKVFLEADCVRVEFTATFTHFEPSREADGTPYFENGVAHFDNGVVLEQKCLYWLDSEVWAEEVQ